MYFPMALAIALGAAVFAAVICMAVSKKSCFKVRVAALAALALMISAVIVALFVVFGIAAAAPEARVISDMPPPEAPPAQEAGSGFLLMLFVLFLLGMFFLVLALSLREQRRHEKAQEAPIKPRSKPRPGAD